MGFIDEGNRDRNLKTLSVLLAEILKTWPEVEFVTSVDLGDRIKTDRFVDERRSRGENKEVII
jgi:hypothetical protein